MKWIRVPDDDREPWPPPPVDHSGDFSGNLLTAVPEGVKINIPDHEIPLKGPNGEVIGSATVTREGDNIMCDGRINDVRFIRDARLISWGPSLHGLGEIISVEAIPEPATPKACDFADMGVLGAEATADYCYAHQDFCEVEG